MSRVYDALRKSESPILKALQQDAYGIAQDAGAANVAEPPVGSEAGRERRLTGEGDSVPAPVVTLANVPCERVNLQPDSRLAFHIEPDGIGADRIRYLRMRLRERWAAGKLRTVLITSPRPGDGKSTIALNLATALAEGGERRVLLLDGDFYRQTIVERLGVQPGIGLGECIEEDLDPVKTMRRIEPLGWYCMPSGKASRNPTELLQSDALSGVVRKLRGLFDWVVIDSPPVVPLSDAVLLSRHADASLLVVRAGRTPSDDIEQALALLGPKRVLGIVLNGAEDLGRRYGYNYGYSGRKIP
jgi:capsular exopolysaccharide synthesis family protein